jgi:glutaredoxin-like protein
LNEDIKAQISEAFGQLKEPVQVLLFEKKENCDYCSDTFQLLEEVTSLSDKLSLSLHDLETDSTLAEQYQVDKAPGIVIAAKDGDEITDYGLRFYGIPSGHEFSSLIYSLILVSGRDSGLDPATREALKELVEPVHLQVFVTPT